MRKSSFAVPTLVLAVLVVSFGGWLAASPAHGAALASAATNWQGVTLDLMSVERKGNVLTLKWAVRNDGAKAQKIRFGLTRKATTYVVDEESGTKYFVLTDKDGHALASQDDWISGDTSGISDELKPGATLRYWAKLPAPPPQVKTLTVLFDMTEPFEGVAITDR